MAVNVWNLLVLMGALQGFILSSVLFFGKNRPNGQFWLAMFVLSIAIFDAETFLWSVGKVANAPFQNATRFTPMLLSGAAFFLYVRQSLRYDAAQRRVWPFLTPIFVDIALRGGLWLSAFWTTPQRYAFFDAKHSWLSKYASVPILWVYVGAAIWLYSRRAETDGTADYQAIIIQKSVRLVLILFLPMAVVWSLTIATADAFWQDGNVFFFYPAAILLSVFIYIAAFAGAHRVRFVYQPTAQPALFHQSIPREDIAQTLEKLQKAVDTEGVYLNPELSLNGLAQHLDVNPKVLSSILNQELGQGFNAFVNAHRVELVKKWLLDDTDQRTVSELAFAAGFNSLPTFQRVFKAQTGVSPKAFLQKNGKNFQSKTDLSG